MPNKSKMSYTRGGLLDSTVVLNAAGQPVLGLGGVLGETGVGAGSGFLTGASIGAAGGPIGAGLGALIGGGMGLIKGLLGNRQEKRMEDRLQEQSLVPQLAAPPRPMSERSFQTGMPNVPTFQAGGTLPPPNADQLKESKSIDKMLIDLDGPIHEEGGIELAGNEVEGNETLFRFKGPDGSIQRYIFSNAVQMPGKKKMSFADGSREIESATSIRPDSDKITNKTKERQLKGLMALQEDLNTKDMGTTMRYGGHMRKLDPGGPLNPSFMFDFFNPVGGTFGGQKPRAAGSFLGSLGGAGGAGGAGGGGGIGNFFSGLFDSTGGLGSSILGSLPGLAGAAGPLAQLKLANQPAEQVQFDRIPEAGRPQFIDPSQQVRSIGETFGGVKGGLRSASSRPGQLQTNLIEAGTREAGAKADVLGQAQNINAGIANQRQRLNQQTRGQNALIGNQESLTNLASEGARQSARIDAISSLGNIGGQFGRDVAQTQAQKRQNQLLMGLLQNAFPNA